MTPLNLPIYFTVQTSIIPTQARADRLNLYVKWLSGEISLLENEHGLIVSPGARLDFCTFFNAFSHRKWNAVTGLSRVLLKISGSGKVLLSILAHSTSAASICIVETELDLEIDGCFVTVPNLGSIPGAILGVEVEAFGEQASLRKMEWVTDEPPIRQVSLAAVITTYRRDQSVIKTIRRFSDETIPALGIGNIHLFIIDNGRTLPRIEIEGVTLIPNPNLGGAGGFARGFLEAKVSGSFSHVLFMDDDAFCEPESVWRTYSLLGRFSLPSSCVSGAMLYESRPTVQYEKGAILGLNYEQRFTWCALGQGAQLSNLEDVCRNDEKDRANYGGWWFFAFPISAVEYFPFPFFVRGDDTDFCLSNKLDVVTLNGICSWCGDLGQKLSPQTYYLSWRSWIALSFMHSSPKSVFRTINTAAKEAARLLSRFDYANAEAIVTAMKDVSHGPDFFGESPAPLEKLRSLAHTNNSLRHLDEADMAILEIASNTYRRRMKIAISLLTMGGNLIPSRFFKKSVLHLTGDKEWSVGMCVNYQSVALGLGNGTFVLKRDKRRFFEVLIRLFRKYVRLTISVRQLRNVYQTQANKFRTPEYWEMVFKKNDQTGSQD